jgi:hypothetical protein
MFRQRLRLAKPLATRFAKWLFLSPVFAKTNKPLTLLPISIFVLLFGALGAAYAELEPALFFYNFQYYSAYSFAGTTALFLFNWIGLFLFAEILSYILYKRVGNDLQLFVCIGMAALPLAVYPYIHLVVPVLLESLGLLSTDPNMIRQVLLVIMQIWSLLLASAAFCFGKGIRLDKAIIISLTAIYLNMAALFMLGRFA